MLDFQQTTDEQGQACISTSIAGKLLLGVHQLNKGTAFTQQERTEFELLGKLPSEVESLSQQVNRCYQQFSNYNDPLNRNIYLNDLHDTNQVLFYRLVLDHLAEMIPFIYTPTVGLAVKAFNSTFRRPRGLYLSYPERQQMKSVLANRSNPDIDVIVVTDGEAVLGIGDQGIGAMDIPIAKLMVYTLCGGINPNRTLPIQLDVGTNNQTLLADPFYLGWHNARLEGQEYHDFIGQFIETVQEVFPNAFLHWEDFGRNNARLNLSRSQNQMCTFNDDMQGTGVVTLAALIAAVKAKKETLKDQRFVVFGAGTAGTGITDQMVAALEREGLTKEAARACFWLIDQPGLLTSDMFDHLTDAQKPYVRDRQEVGEWELDNPNRITLSDVIKNVKPTVLIGCSAVSGAFTPDILTMMAKQVNQPIILPLSNPTERSEATPQIIYEFTEGRAMVATGSPFEPVTYNHKTFRIAQCNNAFVFPGLGLGLVATKARCLSDDTLWLACQALASHAPVLKNGEGPLLPSLDDAREVAANIATVVAQQVMAEGNAKQQISYDLDNHIRALMWEPKYLPYQRRVK